MSRSKNDEATGATRDIVLEGDDFETSSGTSRYAVIIGIDHYDDPEIRDLGFASADAKQIYDVLTDDQLGCIPEAHVQLLINVQATQRNIRSAIGTWLANVAGPRDTVVIYFAGHGAPVINPAPREQGPVEAYLIPSDAEAADLRATGVGMDEVQKWLGYIDSERVLFLIDSCYSGAAGGRTFSQPGVQTRATLTSDFLDGISGQGRTVISACAENQVSLEEATLGHGVFTHYLVEGLRGKADANGDGLVGVDELYQYVSEQVQAHARSVNGKMTPVRKGESQGDFYLVQYETESVRQARGLSAEAREALDAGDVENAERLWRLAIESDNDNQHAAEGLLEVARLHDETKQILDRREGALHEMFVSGAISPQIYNESIKLLEATETSMPRELVVLLADGQLEPGVFLKAWLREENSEAGQQIVAVDTNVAKPFLEVKSIPHPEAKVTIERPSEVESPLEPLPLADEQEVQTVVPADAEPSTDAGLTIKPAKRDIPPVDVKPPLRARKYPLLFGLALCVVLGIGGLVTVVFDGKAPVEAPAQTKTAEEALWDDIGQSDTYTISSISSIPERISLYESYLALPSATPERIAVAQKRIKSLTRSENYSKEVEAWQQALTTNTVAAYRKYQSLPYAKQSHQNWAGEVIKRLNMPAAPPDFIEPQMRAVPSGSFMMGAVLASGLSPEQSGTPVHEVNISAFKLGLYEVTYDEFDIFARETGVTFPNDRGSRGNRPVGGISWQEINDYIDWLNQKTGLTYRLPSESEWEYVARSGTTTKYSFGDDESRLCEFAHSYICREQTDYQIVGSYRANPWGFFDMHGNVKEWVADCWNPSYAGAPSNGDAWLSGDCSRHLYRGGSWNDDVVALTSFFRGRSSRVGTDDDGTRLGNVGFRLALDL